MLKARIKKKETAPLNPLSKDTQSLENINFME